MIRERVARHDGVPLPVVFLHAGEQWIRGSENALLTLLRGLDRTKILPLLFTSNIGLAALARSIEIETTICSIPNLMIDGPNVRLAFLQWAKTVRALTSFMKRHDVKALYCNGGSTCQTGYYAGKLSGIPVISHIHSRYDRRYILGYRFHRASKVITVSRAVQKDLLRKQRFQAEVEVVYNGVDVHRFSPVAERDSAWKRNLGLPPDSVVFGQVSSFLPLKGIDLLLKAFQVVSRSFSNAYLVLVGDGPEVNRYSQLADQLGIRPRTLFEGYRKDPLAYYQHVIDVSILASRTEAFGLSLLEASACGLPNIGSNVGGIAEVISEGVSGFLFEPENHEMLADRMSMLIRQEGLRKQVGWAGRKLAIEQFSLERYCRSIEQIIVGEARRAKA